MTARVSDSFSLQRILERLGFTESLVIRKSRKTYILDKVKVELDDVEGLREFVELEILTESTEGVQDLLERTSKDLGLVKVELHSYAELLTREQALMKPTESAE